MTTNSAEARHGRGLRLACVPEPDATGIAGFSVPVFEVWRGETLLGHVYEQPGWGWWGVTNTRPAQHVSRPRTRAEAVEDLARAVRPRIVCLCGSTRFYAAFQEANYRETMAGHIILSVGFYPHAAAEAHGEDVGISPEEKERLDELHRRKVDLADEVLIVNSDGYVGESTRREIAYARSLGKPIRWLEEPRDG